MKAVISYVAYWHLDIRKVAGGSAVIGLSGYAGLGGTAQYAQPVIYIHPDSLSTAYPLGVGGVSALTAYPAIATGGTQYTSALETLYQPYGAGRDGKHLGKGNFSFVRSCFRFPVHQNSFWT